MTQFHNPYRHLIQITLETEAPLRIGSGEKNVLTDSLVVRDINGLPFIPGTTLAGILAHALNREEKERIMGSQEEGSRLIVTEAKLLDRNGCVMDGIVDWTCSDEENKVFLKSYEQLPIRQHVRIGHKGTTENSGKFDEEAVLKGSRFCFELELMSADKEASEQEVQTLLSAIHSPVFRIGSGNHSGFGEIRVVKCLAKSLDLTNEQDLDLYLGKSSRIGNPWDAWSDVSVNQPETIEGWAHYRLTLQPEDFILFGSGLGSPDSSADMDYVREISIDWNSGKGTIVAQEQNILIPASSVKGALSHRTAFHYNRLSGAFLQDDGTLPNRMDPQAVTGQHNTAVRRIFGAEGTRNKESNKTDGKRRGCILISEILQQTTADTTGSKILNHVSIDRFTGGAIDGALFQEQTLYAKDESFRIDILVEENAFRNESDNTYDENIPKAFEAALKDIAAGLLPLGGGTNRGNGTFTGNVDKYNKETGQWEGLN